MSQKLPEIRIKDAWLLRENASVPINELWGQGEPMRSDEEYAEIAERYRKAWKPFDQKILSAMTDLLGVSFRQNIIDVYIAPWFSAFSDPIVIGVIFKSDEFVDLLTHELLHRLLTDNNEIAEDTDPTDEWRKLFGDQHNLATLLHIPVHAVHKAIYLDILKSPYDWNKTSREMKKNEGVDYLKSWQYVDANDYKKIVADLKNLYSTM